MSENGQGQSHQIAEGESSNHHFIVFLENKGRLLEFDGLKPAPIGLFI